jgi:hypothetical protein
MAQYILGSDVGYLNRIYSENIIDIDESITYRKYYYFYFVLGVTSDCSFPSLSYTQ